MLTIEGKSRYKLLASGVPEGGRGPDYVAFVFVSLGSVIIRSSFKLTLSDQTQIILQIGAILSDIVQRFLLVHPTLEVRQFFFLTEPKPALAGRESNSYNPPGFCLSDWVIPNRFSKDALDL